MLGGLLDAPAAALVAGQMLGLALRTLILGAVLWVVLARRGLLAGRPAFTLVAQATVITMVAVVLVRLVAWVFLSLIPLPLMGLAAAACSLIAGYVALNAMLSRLFDLDLDHAHSLTLEIGGVTVLLWLILGAGFILLRGLS